MIRFENKLPDQAVTLSRGPANDNIPTVDVLDVLADLVNHEVHANSWDQRSMFDRTAAAEIRRQLKMQMGLAV